MAFVKIEGTWTGGGEGVGAALHGSRPSYVEAASGFSSTKLPPKLEEIPYACVGRGALNIVVEDERYDSARDRDRLGRDSGAHAQPSRVSSIHSGNFTFVARACVYLKK